MLLNLNRQVFEGLRIGLKKNKNKKPQFEPDGSNKVEPAQPMSLPVFLFFIVIIIFSINLRNDFFFHLNAS